MTQSLGFILPDRKYFSHIGNGLHFFQSIVFSARSQKCFQLRYLIKMIDDAFFVAAVDNQDFFNSGCHNFFNDILDRRFVDDR